MNFLLDTNVISEYTKPAPNPGIVAWITETDEETTFLSCLTVGELAYGIGRLPNGARKSRLANWLADLRERFQGRILPVDDEVSIHWGGLRVEAEATGRTIGIVDGLIAATAQRHGHTLVSRDARAFGGIVDDVVNPWTAEE